MKLLTIHIGGADRKIRLSLKVLNDSGILGGASLEAIGRAIHGGLQDRKENETLEWVMDQADPDTLQQFTRECAIHYPSVFGNTDPQMPRLVA